METLSFYIHVWSLTFQIIAESSKVSYSIDLYKLEPKV